MLLETALELELTIYRNCIPAGHVTNIRDILGQIRRYPATFGIKVYM